MLHSQIWIREIDIFIPVRKTFIMSITHIYVDHIGIPKHEKHLRFLSSGMKLFITFELKGFFDIRREIPSFNAVFSISPKPRGHPPQGHWPFRQASESQSSSSEPGTQLTFLKSQPTLPVRDVTHIPGHIVYLGFLLWHLWLTRPLRVRVNTCAHVCT